MMKSSIASRLACFYLPRVVVQIDIDIVTLFARHFVMVGRKAPPPSKHPDCEKPSGKGLTESRSLVRANNIERGSMWGAEF